MGDILMENVSRSGSTVEMLQYPDGYSYFDQINAISVEGVYKRYGKEIVLNNMNMTVPEGCIYGLLGSSGCGKTTLLNCLIGIINIDVGELYIKYKKSDIGMMPQETALVFSLTIKEILNYFGKMFNMSDRQISDRIFELTEVLKLPDNNSRIKKLSGGEQRRVSLAVALLHDPKLLLLDEPTVGLDPILSKSIWDYIVTITNAQHKTVIITTHYIEEAKRAHFVGLMRQGRLAETGPPTQIMEKYNCSSLEDAFLQVCQKDEIVDTEWPNISTEHPFRKKINKNEIFSFARFRAQFYKNTLFVVRQRAFLILLIVLPIIQCNSVNWGLGRDPHGISFAVVNDDVVNCSVYNCTYPGCLLEGFSCCFMEDLQERVKNFNFVYKDHFSEGRELVERNDAWGVIYFPNNFSRILKMRTLKFFKKGLTNKTIESGQIQVYLDSTNKVIDMFTKRKLLNTFFDFMGRRFNDCGWESRAAQYPLKLENPIYGSKEPVFTHYQTPAVVMAFCFFLPMMVTPSILLDEKLSGFLPRSIASGLTITELLAALFSVQVIMLVIQVAIIFIILYGIYGHPFLTNLWLPFVISIYAGISGMCFGILISLASSRFYQAVIVGNGMLIIIIMSQGGLWPIEGAHPYVKEIMWCSPLALAVDSLRSMTVRGWSILHPSVYFGFIAITAWNLVYISLSLLIGVKKGMRIKK